MGHTAHQRSEYQIPARHGRAECVHLDPLRENESHEGCVAADARLCSSLSFYPARPSGRGRAAIAKWSTKPCLFSTSFYCARYYNPGTGRFLSEDEVGNDEGTNLYLYAGNSPIDAPQRRNERLPCRRPRHASTKSPLSNRKNTIATPPRASSTST